MIEMIPAHRTLYGARGIRLEDAGQGRQRMIDVLALPLETVLRGNNDADFYGFRSDLMLYSDQEYTAVPRGEESVAWCLDQLANSKDDKLAEMVSKLYKLYRSYKEDSSLYKEAFGVDELPKDAEPNDLSPEPLIMLLRLLANRCAAQEDEPRSERDVLFDLIVQHPSPFRDREAVEATLNKYLSPVSVEGMGEVWVPVRQEQESLAIDMVAPDFSSRIWIMRNGDGPFTAVAVCNTGEGHERLARVSAEHTEVASFDGIEDLLKWTDSYFTADPKTASATAFDNKQHIPGQPVRAKHFALLGLSGECRLARPLEEVVAVFRPDPEKVDGASGKWSPAGTAIDYEPVQWLRRRAKALGVKGYSKLDADELRVAVGEAAAAACPLETLLGDRGAAFITTPYDEVSAEAPINQAVLALESLTVHTGSGGLAGASMDPLGIRLTDTLTPRQAVRPVSPFLQFSDE